jgi:hypothetical protein
MCDTPLDPVTQSSLAQVFTDGAPPSDVCSAMSLGVNSPQFLAGLATDYITGLKSVPLTPSFAARYNLFLDYLAAAAQGPGITPQQLLLIWSSLGDPAFAGYERLPTKAPYLTFPADHNMHFGVQTEWYFLVGNGVAPNASGVAGSPTVPYGVEFMVMMHDLFPLNFLTARGIDPAAFRFYDIHFGVTIGAGAGAQYFRSPSVILVPGSSGAVNYSPLSPGAPFFLSIGDCAFASTSDKDLFPMNVQCTALDQNANRVTVALSVAATKPFFLEGAQGCEPCVSGLGTLYYSYPSLSATGTLAYSGGTLTIPADGKWWLDHQWMAGMPGGYPNSLTLRAYLALRPNPFVGWDWFEWSVGGVPDGSGALWKSTDFTMYATRSAPLAAIPAGEIMEKANGKIIDTGGNSQDATSNLFLGGWITSSDGTIWPTSWRFEFASQAATPAVMYSLTPYYPLTVGWLTFMGELYKEGPVSVAGSDGSVGVGFAESVGYPLQAHTTQSNLAILGITDPSAPALLQAPKISAGLKAQSGLFILLVLIIILLVICGIVHGVRRLVRGKKETPRAPATA